MNVRDILVNVVAACPRLNWLKREVSRLPPPAPGTIAVSRIGGASIRGNFVVTAFAFAIVQAA